MRFLDSHGSGDPVSDGIRIQPQKERLRSEGITDVANRLFVVRDVSRPIKVIPESPVCPHCGYPHDCKAYHLQLDAEGTVMVSTTIWENMLKLFDQGGFEKVNVVGDPPDQRIILPSASVGITPALM
jgi:hypothetical protein